MASVVVISSTVDTTDVSPTSSVDVVARGSLVSAVVAWVEVKVAWMLVVSVASVDSISVVVKTSSDVICEVSEDPIVVSVAVACRSDVNFCDVTSSVTVECEVKPKDAGLLGKSVLVIDVSGKIKIFISKIIKIANEGFTE